MSKAASKAASKCLAYCEEKYPEYRGHIAVDTGEIVAVFLRSKDPAWADRDLVVYYNTWYTDEFSTYKLVPILDEKRVNNATVD